MFMIIEEIKALGVAAARAVAERAPEAEVLLRSAKSHVGTAGLWACEQAVHLHGAMGVANEAVIGQYLKRLVVAERLFGDAEHHLSVLATRPIA
jgi:alkylation response protein AidB-like acyl-CoA dehydrogenase